MSALLFGFCLSFFLHGFASFFEAKVFHTFTILRLSHCQDRALERDRPQQRKQKSYKSCMASLFCDGSLFPCAWLLSPFFLF